MNKIIRICCLLLSLILVSCTVVSAATFPTGSFTKQDNENYVLLFRDEGKFDYYYYDEIVTSGTYSIKGNELTWETDNFCENQYNSGKATYIWSFEKDRLTFTLKGNDRCLDRQEVLHQVTYIKQK